MDNAAYWFELGVVSIGLSHLLQPPLTFWLAKHVLGLDRAFGELPPLARRIARIMALTAVVLPTTLGIVVSTHPREVLAGGAPWTVALVLATMLWTPRLIAQLVFVGPLFPPDRRRWHWLLVSIFLVQGPGFLVLLLVGHDRSVSTASSFSDNAIATTSSPVERSLVNDGDGDTINHNPRRHGDRIARTKVVP